MKYTTEQNEKHFIKSECYVHHTTNQVWELLAFNRSTEKCPLYEVYLSNLSTNEEFTTVGASLDFASLEAAYIANLISRDYYENLIEYLRKVRDGKNST
jgi:hypothetical protein